MSEAHEGQVVLRHTFREVYDWLTRSGPVNLRTDRRSTAFQAMAGFASRGPHAGERVIRFTSKGRESARAYECCWGRYHNCSGRASECTAWLWILRSTGTGRQTSDTTDRPASSYWQRISW